MEPTALLEDLRQRASTIMQHLQGEKRRLEKAKAEVADAERAIAKDLHEHAKVKAAYDAAVLVLSPPRCNSKWTDKDSPDWGKERPYECDDKMAHFGPHHAYNKRWTDEMADKEP